MKIRNITYIDNRNFNTIKLSNINKNTFLFIFFGSVDSSVVYFSCWKSVGVRDYHNTH